MDKELKIFKQTNLIPIIANTDIYDLTEEELENSVTLILENINKKKLRKSVLDAIEDLSGVTAPNEVANPKWIALDNQKRLEIINRLLSQLRYTEKDIKILKTKRNMVDYDYEFRFLENIKSLCKGIIEYVELKQSELEDSLFQPNLLDIMHGIKTKEQKKQLKLNEENRKLLKGE